MTDPKPADAKNQLDDLQALWREQKREKLRQRILDLKGELRDLRAEMAKLGEWPAQRSGRRS